MSLVPALTTSVAYAAASSLQCLESSQPAPPLGNTEAEAEAAAAAAGKRKKEFFKSLLSWLYIVYALGHLTFENFRQRRRAREQRWQARR